MKRVVCLPAEYFDFIGERSDRLFHEYYRLPRYARLTILRSYLEVNMLAQISCVRLLVLHVHL